jgi:hypothetical protein
MITTFFRIRPSPRPYPARLLIHRRFDMYRGAIQYLPHAQNSPLEVSHSRGLRLGDSQPPLTWGAFATCAIRCF